MKGSWTHMTLSEFMEAFSIAILCIVDENETIHTIHSQHNTIESKTLYEQIVIYGNPQSIIAQTEGQLLPRMIEQGSSQCTIMKKADLVLCAFYDCFLSPMEKIQYAMKMNGELENVDISLE